MGCSSPTEINEDKGNIYGVITDSNAEPVRAASISLFNYSITYPYGEPFLQRSLLLKTVTFDDGHYEFNDIEPKEYYLEVEKNGYSDESMFITVDMMLTRIETGLTILTSSPHVNGSSVTFEGKFRYKSGNSPDEYGFVYGQQKNPTKEQDNIVKSSNAPSYTTSGDYYNFSSEVSSINKGTYHVRAYAINKLGISYGEDREFNI